MSKNNNGFQQAKKKLKAKIEKVDETLPRISICFSGWLRKVPIKKATNSVTHKDIDVSKMSSEELVDKLKNGELLISFSDALDNASEQEVELFDYDTE